MHDKVPNPVILVNSRQHLQAPVVYMAKAVDMRLHRQVIFLALGPFDSLSDGHAGEMLQRL
jgi:hypothetical protein